MGHNNPIQQVLQEAGLMFPDRHSPASLALERERSDDQHPQTRPAPTSASPPRDRRYATDRHRL